MNTDVIEKPRQQLFRDAATRAAGQRLFGSLSVVMPPSATLAALTGLLALAALAFAAVVVEVPLRAKAVGVLMPPHGFLEVVTAEAGRISRVHVTDGQQVQAGELLFEVAANGSNVPGQSHSGLILRSLRNEQELRRVLHEQQVRALAERLVAVQAEQATASRRLQVAHRQLVAHVERMHILEARFERWQALAGDGHVSRDALDLERATLIEARTISADLEQQRIGFNIDAARLEQMHAELLRQVELQHAEHKLEQEKLRGEIELNEYRDAQGIRAAADGIVARVQVRPGFVVARGQVVAKLYQPGDYLDAWLYLSSSSARLLRPGQQVMLQLDAWPQEVFGTRSATVTSVSGIALEPDEIAAPLTLPGPVFEVRAELHDSSVAAYGSNWPIAPGTSFQADVIQRRLRLYQWLLRSLQGTGEHA